MGGDFNCHSCEWNDEITTHGTTAIQLLEIGADLGLELALPSNPGPTFIPRDRNKRHTVIDLIFLEPPEAIAHKPRRDLDLQGASDHIPISSSIILASAIPDVTMWSMKEDPVVQEAFAQ